MTREIAIKIAHRYMNFPRHGGISYSLYSRARRVLKKTSGAPKLIRLSASPSQRLSFSEKRIYNAVLSALKRT